MRPCVRMLADDTWELWNVGDLSDGWSVFLVAVLFGRPSRGSPCKFWSLPCAPDLGISLRTVREDVVRTSAFSDERCGYSGIQASRCISTKPKLQNK